MDWALSCTRRKLKQMGRTTEEARQDAIHTYTYLKNELFRGATDWVSALGNKELDAHLLYGGPRGELLTRMKTLGRPATLVPPLAQVIPTRTWVLGPSPASANG